MRFAQLEGQRVAVWGAGREGRAALSALAAKPPGPPVTLWCHQNEVEALEAQVARGAQRLPETLRIDTKPPDAEALAGFDFVIKSPGISPRKPELVRALQRGVRFTSGTALWFGENPQARVVGITGSKGKSTTSALLAHLARSLGIRTALAGNIGLPLLELDGQQADLWVVELSSFQTGEAGVLGTGVVTSLFPEHVDWHGSVERYYADKLKLADQARCLLVNGSQDELLRRTAGHPHRLRFAVREGWHVRDVRGAAMICRGEDVIVEAAILPLPGAHNLVNACAALAALEQAGFDAVAAAPHLDGFRALPHRLQVLGQRDGLTWVDDSIATTPDASLAAIASLPARPLGLIVGGHDRGLNWSGFAEKVAGMDDLRMLVQGENAERIATALQAQGVQAHHCGDLAAAVDYARQHLPGGSCVALSPGAPSFDQFANYRERGRRFAALAGFPGLDSEILGLGII